MQPPQDSVLQWALPIQTLPGWRFVQVPLTGAAIIVIAHPTKFEIVLAIQPISTIEVAEATSSEIEGKFAVSNSTIDFSGWSFSSGDDHCLKLFVHHGYLFHVAVINGEYFIHIE